MLGKMIFDGNCVEYKGVNYCWRKERWCYAQNNLIVPLDMDQELSRIFKPVKEKIYPEKIRPKGLSQSSRKAFQYCHGGIPGLGKRR